MSACLAFLSRICSEPPILAVGTSPMASRKDLACSTHACRAVAKRFIQGHMGSIARNALLYLSRVCQTKKKRALISQFLKIKCLIYKVVGRAFFPRFYCAKVAQNLLISTDTSRSTISICSNSVLKTKKGDPPCQAAKNS